MWQPVLMISGYILSILGLTMFLPACLDIFGNDADWSPFVSAALITVFFGTLLFLSNHTKIEHISLRQGYLITAVSWIMVCLFASLPFIMHHSTENITDALFEAVSGITGTGATIMNDVESLPQSVLLWRSLLNCIGGLGIVIFAVALLPFLGIGGMQMFQHENSDSNGKFMPKFSYIAKRIVLLYSVLIVIASLCLFECGMGWFDAINHAMSAIGTGGFSTKNDSLAYFDSITIDFTVMIFMLAGALPMTFYILLLRGATPDKNRQVRVFLKIIVVCAVALISILYTHSGYSLLETIRYGLFTVIATITTTGLTVCDYTQWGVWITSLILFMSLIGGCTGSTSGSIKVFRWQVVYLFLRKYFLTIIEPHRVIPIKIGEVNLPEKASLSVFVYMLSFVVSLAILTIAVSLLGVEIATALSAVSACITNVGVGAINIIGPAGNYAFFDSSVKLILCCAMLIGRLEIITVFVLFSRSFWRS